MTKQQYLSLCLRQPIEWLQQCAASPSAYMRPLHVALIRIAIRRKSV